MNDSRHFSVVIGILQLLDICWNGGVMLDNFLPSSGHVFFCPVQSGSARSSFDGPCLDCQWSASLAVCGGVEGRLVEWVRRLSPKDVSKQVQFLL